MNFEKLITKCDTAYVHPEAVEEYAQKSNYCI